MQHTRTHARTHMHTCTHACAHTHLHTRARAHTHTCSTRLTPCASSISISAPTSNFCPAPPARRPRWTQSCRREDGRECFISSSSARRALRGSVSLGHPVGNRVPVPCQAPMWSLSGLALGDPAAQGQAGGEGRLPDLADFPLTPLPSSRRLSPGSSA